MWRLLPLLALVAGIPVFAAGPNAQLYDEQCSGCHTIGGGDGAGPDLVVSTKWPDADLRVALKRMEDNVGPLTDAQVDALIAFLKNEPQAKPAVVEQPKGVVETGKKLFFGEARLQNGGSPCFACHTVGGIGGNVAADLTAIHQQRSAAALMSATANPGFPMMKAAYAHRPVTDEEARHLVAFLQSASPASASTAKPVGIAALSFAGVMLGAIAFVSRARKAGVRARLVNKG